MPALCLGQSFRVVEAVVEVHTKFAHSFWLHLALLPKTYCNSARPCLDPAPQNQCNKSDIGYTSPVWLTAPSTITSPTNEIAAALATGKRGGMRASNEYLSNNRLA
jgi:hypothetical protein